MDGDSVMSVGGRLGYEDAGETPNTQIVYQAYKTAPLIFEVRGLPKTKDAQKAKDNSDMDDIHGARVGCVIHCEGGYVVVRDTICRLFGFHTLLRPDGAFCFDHLFGF